jgi:hypothetical protein
MVDEKKREGLGSITERKEESKLSESLLKI